MTNNIIKSTRYFYYYILMFIVNFVLAIILTYFLSNDLKGLSLWFAGAGSLGLLSGYTTGLSDPAGATSELLKFISGGVLVPLFGGFATLLSSSNGNGVFTFPDNAVTGALAIFGGFLIFYSFFTAIGVYYGLRSKEDGISIKF